MNQHHSIYSADCLCGRHFEMPSREYVGPACGRYIVLAWGEDSADDESASATSVDLLEASTK
jgi:hypothetical protein